MKLNSSHNVKFLERVKALGLLNFISSIIRVWSSQSFYLMGSTSLQFLIGSLLILDMTKAEVPKSQQRRLILGLGVFLILSELKWKNLRKEIQSLHDNVCNHELRLNQSEKQLKELLQMLQVVEEEGMLEFDLRCSDLTDDDLNDFLTEDDDDHEDEG